jgi:hypothetical protein
MLKCLRLAPDETSGVGPESPAVRDRNVPADSSIDGHFDSELLAALSDQCVDFELGVLDLSTRQLPQSGECLRSGPLRHEQPSVTSNRRTDNHPHAY